MEEAYRQSVVDTPYCSISVKSLCEKAGITRKAFYKRFGSKGDVLRAVFERDVIRPQIELIELLSFQKMRLRAPQMEQHMLQAVFDDGAFYRNVVTAPQGGREAFLKAASKAFYDFDKKMLDEFHYHADEWQAESTARFFAHGKAHYFLDWIEGDFSVSVDDASKLYSRMVLPFWSSLA